MLPNNDANLTSAEKGKVLWDERLDEWLFARVGEWRSSRAAPHADPDSRDVRYRGHGTYSRGCPCRHGIYEAVDVK